MRDQFFNADNTAVLRPAPADFAPDRAVVTTASARVVFYDQMGAREQLKNPGDLPIVAQLYLDWLNNPQSLSSVPNPVSAISTIEGTTQ